MWPDGQISPAFYTLALGWKFWKLYDLKIKYSIEKHFWDISALRIIFGALIKSPQRCKASVEVRKRI